jgi:predicted subunit of tRNA(5-methylaminomethyl-2-thiouridylate) methyltransferase
MIPEDKRNKVETYVKRLDGKTRKEMKALVDKKFKCDVTYDQLRYLKKRRSAKDRKAQYKKELADMAKTYETETPKKNYADYLHDLMKGKLTQEAFNKLTF